MVQRSSRFVFVRLIGLMCVLFSLSPSQAAWRQVMTDGFENPANTWTWFMPPAGWVNSREWAVVSVNAPPWPFISDYPHWGIQDFLCFPDPAYPELFRQAAWCDASTHESPPLNPAGRDPEFDRYRPNMHTHMRWGPFRTDSISIRLDATTTRMFRVRNARASFKWINHTAPGDTFFWEAAWSNGGTPPNPLTQRSLWYTALASRPILDSLGNYTGRDTLVRGWHCGRAFQYWNEGVIKLDSLDSAGTIISLLNKPNVWVGWRFKSNTSNDSLLGAFVDNLKISIDDGLFDLSTLRCSAWNARDTSVLSYPQVGDSLLFHCRYRVAGYGVLRDSTGAPRPIRIACMINNLVFWDTTLTVSAGDDALEYGVYAPRYIVPIEGEYTVSWMLDADNVVMESSETNNICSTTFIAITPNIPPTFAFLSHNVARIDTVYRVAGRNFYIPVVVNAQDGDDSASYYIFNSQDSAIGAGTVIASNYGFPRFEHDQIDTVLWNVGVLPDGIWYMSAVIQDQFNEPCWAQAQTAVCLQTVSAVNEPSAGIPTTTALERIYPNPFNSDLNVTVALAKAGNVRLSMFDVNGRVVGEMSMPNRAAGYHTLNWKPTQLASGVYFIELRVDAQIIASRKTLYIK